MRTGHTRATSRLLLSGIAESVENVLHVAGLPYRRMTASHLTGVQPNLLSPFSAVLRKPYKAASGS